MFKLFSLSPRSRARLAAALLTCSIPVAGWSQDEPKKELSDKVSEELGKLKGLTDAKNYDGALTLINGLIATAPANSYDLAILSQIKAQVLLTKSDYAASIPPLEKAVELGDRYKYFDDRQIQDLVYYLSQLYYQEATTVKDPTLQRSNFEKASASIRRWLKNNTKPNPDAQLFAASILYNQATLNPEQVDQKLVAQAKSEAEKGLLMSIKPKDTFYVLILAALQQQGNMKDAAELLELLVKQSPTNRQYWQQLAGAYLALGGDLAEKDPKQSLEYNIRTVLTIERAQQHGLMNTPKDNFNLVGILINIQQFDRAAALLEKGLRDGSIDNEQRNWEFLASSYQQMRKEFKAIETLKEASKQFPKAGSLEFQIANIYYSLDKLDDSYKHAHLALEKGGLDKPWSVQLFAAYMAYELKKYDEALKLAEDAAKVPEAKDAGRLVRAIKDAIAEREAAIKGSSTL